ncbi:MAG: hypothetical protein JWQ89_3235 [Devosia sp.]|uniref:peptidase inhibitor family I36 protein n=1 Tax=Devosia sp. TaxID=1871048 RepID=UPI00261433F0|nr:SH3 domain-containing protein [Devosia sp.]MDB5541508.1 hypothetical protein [Devosia sp.]
MKQLFASLSALVFLILAMGTASAQTVGTPAWSIRPLVLFEGPGRDYDVTGQIEGQVRIYVDRCSKLWCRVHAGGQAGWTSLYDVAFGRVARGPLTGPRLNYKWGGPGQVCLYEGHNYTGSAICGRSGTRIRDLLLLHADNLYSSVTIEGDVSVMLCRDRDFHSYCELMNNSGNLQGFLDNNVSSVQVY